MKYLWTKCLTYCHLWMYLYIKCCGLSLPVVKCVYVRANVSWCVFKTCVHIAVILHQHVHIMEDIAVKPTKQFICLQITNIH